MTKKSIALVGGGPAAMAFASLLDLDKFDLTLYEKNQTLGRKFLVAGKGGFNLTHSEPIEDLCSRYTPSSFLRKALLQFDNQFTRKWLNDLGIDTFIGSSKRVFPVSGTKPIEVLNKITEHLEKRGVQFSLGERWTGWNDENALTFASGKQVKADWVVFALGGGSWKVTGSDGSWLPIFVKKNIGVHPFQPANCAFKIQWDKEFIRHHEGKPLKNIALCFEGKEQLGELMITQFGIEGSPVYALSKQINERIIEDGSAVVGVDFKPQWSEDIVRQKLETSEGKMSDKLRQVLRLQPAALALIKSALNKEDFLSAHQVAQHIKKLEIPLLEPAPIDEAISTTGGVSTDAVNEVFELQVLKNHCCIGEMLEWNAPTGGYLLQACFSMGFYLAHQLSQCEE